jgi:hypothetical protein
MRHLCRSSPLNRAWTFLPATARRSGSSSPMPSSESHRKSRSTGQSAGTGRRRAARHDGYQPRSIGAPPSPGGRREPVRRYRLIKGVPSRGVADLRSLSLIILVMAAMQGSSISAVRIERTAHRFRQATFPQIRDTVWSGTGSNCRPSAFQVNRAKRCADLRKRTLLTSGSALGGRCESYGNRTRYIPSIRQDSDPTQSPPRPPLA